MAHVIDEEVHDLVSEAYRQVESLLSAHQPTLDRIAQELRRHELLDTKQLLAILAETDVALGPDVSAGKDERPSAAPPVDDFNDTLAVS